MLSVLKRLWSLLTRKEVVSVFLMVFVADVVVGIFSPTFSLFATSLGASVTLIGVLSSVRGLTRTLASIPVGMVSDSSGRRIVLLSGMLLLSGSAFLYSLISSPYALLPLRMITGVVISATFFIGMAYMGDQVAKEDRGLASGVYTSCMGLGFTVGSALGGGLAASAGYVATFRVAAAIALAGFLVAWWGLAKPVDNSHSVKSAENPLARLGLLAREPQLLAASLGYLLIILMFDAAVVNFFPLYAAGVLAISQTGIGSMMAIRALVSTSVRLPTGMLSTRIASRHLMVTALTIGMLMMLAICCVNSPAVLTLVLAGEGICFGMYLTAGQAFITENFAQSERGTAMGVYSMTGSIGSTAGPFVMGAVGDALGLKSVFVMTGILVFVGILVFLYASSRPSPTESLLNGGNGV